MLNVLVYYGDNYATRPPLPLPSTSRRMDHEEIIHTRGQVRSFCQSTEGMMLRTRLRADMVFGGEFISLLLLNFSLTSRIARMRNQFGLP